MTIPSDRGVIDTVMPAWIPETRRAAQTYRRARIASPCRKRFVYVLLVRGREGLALYVGETGNSPERRLNDHRTAVHAAPSLGRYEVLRLLPDHYEHLNPVIDADIHEVEQELHQRLVAILGPRLVLGGH